MPKCPAIPLFLLISRWTLRNMDCFLFLAETFLDGCSVVAENRQKIKCRSMTPGSHWAGKLHKGNVVPIETISWGLFANVVSESPIQVDGLSISAKGNCAGVGKMCCHDFRAGVDTKNPPGGRNSIFLGREHQRDGMRRFPLVKIKQFVSRLSPPCFKNR